MKRRFDSLTVLGSLAAILLVIVLGQMLSEDPNPNIGPPAIRAMIGGEVAPSHDGHMGGPGCDHEWTVDPIPRPFWDDE